MHLPRSGLALVTAFTLSACGDANLLPPATGQVVFDTIALWAASGTPIGYPDAFDLILNIPVRTDRSGTLDFAFDYVVDSLGDTVPALIPRGALNLTADGGLKRVVGLFDTLYIAPATGYNATQPVYLDPEVTVFARSRSEACNFGITSAYFAKLQAIDINPVERKVVLRLALDPNCGYRGLAPGLPQQ